MERPLNPRLGRALPRGDAAGAPEQPTTYAISVLMCRDAARLPASSAAAATVARFLPTILPPVASKMIRIRNGSRNEANFCSEINRGRNEDSRRKSPIRRAAPGLVPAGATLHSRRRDVRLHGRRSYSAD